jgi:hypothetical protein
VLELRLVQRMLQRDDVHHARHHGDVRGPRLRLHRV